MNDKILHIRRKLEHLNIDGMIISKPENLRYLIGIEAEGILLITDQENIFITDKRYIEYARTNISIEDDINVYDSIGISEEEYFTYFENCVSVGFEENYITYRDYENYIVRFRIKEMVATNQLIEKMRMIKDKKEIELIRKACEITDECFEHIKEYIKVGMTEKDVYFEIYRFMLSKGGEALAFDSIVASGKNSSKPHSKVSDKMIREGDILTLDFGVKYQGYVSDMTRTIFVRTIDENVKEMYNFIKNQQERAIEKMIPGADTRTIAKDLEYYFLQNNYILAHALGHGLRIKCT